MSLKAFRIVTRRVIESTSYADTYEQAIEHATTQAKMGATLDVAVHQQGEDGWIYRADFDGPVMPELG